MEPALHGCDPSARSYSAASFSAACAAFNSAAYKQAKVAGDKYATFRVYAVEGVTP